MKNELIIEKMHRRLRLAVEIGDERQVAAHPLQVAEVFQRGVHADEVLLHVDLAHVGRQHVGHQRQPRDEIPRHFELEGLSEALQDLLRLGLLLDALVLLHVAPEEGEDRVPVPVADRFLQWGPPLVVLVGHWVAVVDQDVHDVMVTEHDRQVQRVVAVHVFLRGNHLPVFRGFLQVLLHHGDVVVEDELVQRVIGFDVFGGVHYFFRNKF